MAFKEKQILKYFLFVWLNFIKVSGFVVFEEKKLNSLGSFIKNARIKESIDQGYEKTKSADQVGRLLVWQDQASHSHGRGTDRFSSDQPDENGYQSDDSGKRRIPDLMYYFMYYNVYYNVIIMYYKKIH